MSARIMKALLRLIYPRRAVCMGCGERVGCDRDDLCEDCRERLALNRLGPENPPKHSGISAMAFAYRYEGPAGGLVRRLKYGGVWHLAEGMAEDMVQPIELMRLERIDCVSFVPMHPRRQRRRGKNQSALLAQHLSEKLGCPCEALLRRTRNATQQARLDAEQRRKNLRGVFQATRRLDGMRILLVDDVYTTGATAQECAAEMRAAGAESVYFIAFARGTHAKK